MQGMLHGHHILVAIVAGCSLFRADKAYQTVAYASEPDDFVQWREGLRKERIHDTRSNPQYGTEWLVHDLAGLGYSTPENATGHGFAWYVRYSAPCPKVPKVLASGHGLMRICRELPLLKDKTQQKKKLERFAADIDDETWHAPGSSNAASARFRGALCIPNSLTLGMFFPRTFHANTELGAFQEMATAHPDMQFILKIRRSEASRGMQVLTAAEAVAWASQATAEAREKTVLQQYLHRPSLWEGRKYSLRTHAVIISTEPLLVLYRDGEVKRCLEPYDSPAPGLERFAQLTNSARQHPQYEAMTRRWGYHIAWRRWAQWMAARRGASFVGAVVRPMLKAQMRYMLASYLYQSASTVPAMPFVTLQHMCFDFMLDDVGRVWLHESNAGCSLYAPGTSEADDPVQRDLRTTAMQLAEELLYVHRRSLCFYQPSARRAPVACTPFHPRNTSAPHRGLLAAEPVGAAALRRADWGQFEVLLDAMGGCGAAAPAYSLGLFSRGLLKQRQPRYALTTDHVQSVHQLVDAVQALAESGALRACGVFAAIIGGQSFLSALGRLPSAPRHVLLVDRHLPQIRWAQFVLNLVLLTPTRDAFVSRLFGRPGARQLCEALDPAATAALRRWASAPNATDVDALRRRLMNQTLGVMETPCDREIVAAVRDRLLGPVSPEVLDLWEYMVCDPTAKPRLLPVHVCSHRTYCPELPQGKGMGIKLLGKAAQALHVGAGWLESADSYMRLREQLRSISSLQFRTLDLMQLWKSGLPFLPQEEEDAAAVLYTTNALFNVNFFGWPKSTQFLRQLAQQRPGPIFVLGLLEKKDRLPQSLWCCRIIDKKVGECAIPAAQCPALR